MQNDFKDYSIRLKAVLDQIDLSMLETITSLLRDSIKQGCRIFVFGNGGSAMTASHFACDINKGVGQGKDLKPQVFCLNDSMATVLAYANDMSYADIFSEQLKNFFNPGDLVLAFSGSGNSENVLQAMHYANQNGGITIGFSGYDGGELARIVQHSMHVPINDMQIAEDVHLVLVHMIMQSLMKTL